MKLFTEQERADIVAWFEANADKLPATAKLSDSETITNVPKFVNQSCGIIKSQGNNPIFTRFIQKLFELKKIIENP